MLKSLGLLTSLLAALMVSAYAQAIENSQMSLLDGMSLQEKQKLAKSAGVDFSMGLSTEGKETFNESLPVVVPNFNVNDVSNPSAIEASVWKRLGIVVEPELYHHDELADRQAELERNQVSDEELRSIDRSYYSRFGGKTFNSDSQDTSPPQEPEARKNNNDNEDLSANKPNKDHDAKKTDFDPDKIWKSWLDTSEAEETKKKPIFQFGYELFSGSPTTFAPVSEVPVPSSYIVGPGDELNLQFYGQQSDALKVVVDRSGMVELPDIGTVRLAGSTFVDAKALIADEVRKKAIGVTVSISMGRLRSMRVFVLGDVNHPGSYMVSSLSSMSHALFVAGGVSKQGSLRKVHLKRRGKTIKTLDLYDFLLKGDSANDKNLLEGDVVFVEPIGKTVAVYGEVNRPAIYELKREKKVSDVVRLAGGLTSSADRKHKQVERLTHEGGRVLIDLSPAKATSIKAGDIVIIHASPAVEEQFVELMGEVKRPGKYGYREGMRLDSILSSRKDLRANAYSGFVLIQKTNVINGVVNIERVVLEDLFARPHAEWPTLGSGDKVYVFSRSLLNPLQYVMASGEFLKPGKYPLGGGMTLLNLVLSAGGVTDKAYLKEVEIARYSVDKGRKRSSDYLTVNLSDVLNGSVDFKLQAYDEVLVRKISQWGAIARVEVTGEVVFPSVYPIERGEKLSVLLKRAGGFTDAAYLEAAIFTRESIREEQQKQLDDMVSRMKVEIAQEEESITTLHDAQLVKQKQTALAAAKRVLGELEATKATGRLVIQLKDINELEDSEFNLTLRDGDSLYVPQRPDQVMIMGQVYNTTSLLYQSDYDAGDYIDAAGGMTRLADANRAYVVRANGFVERIGLWRNTDVHPGDTVVVPQELDQFNLLDSTLDWSRVLMQVGVGLASMKTIGVF